MIGLRIFETKCFDLQFLANNNKMLKLCIRLYTKLHNRQSYLPPLYLFMKYNVLGENVGKHEKLRFKNKNALFH